MFELVLALLAISLVVNLVLIPLAIRGVRKVLPLEQKIAAMAKVQSELGHQVERKYGPKKAKRLAGATLAAVKQMRTEKV